MTSTTGKAVGWQVGAVHQLHDAVPAHLGGPVQSR